MKIILKILGFALCMFGVVFVSLLVHEGVHILQSKSPISICYDMQQATLMSTYHSPEDFTDEEFRDFRTYSEKWAYFGEILVQTVLSVGIGIVLAGFYIVHRGGFK